MNLFFDTEFTGLRRNTTLISIGIVSENGKKFYAEFADYNRSQCDKWIKKNVICNLFLRQFPIHRKFHPNFSKIIVDGEKYELIDSGIYEMNGILEYSWRKIDGETTYVYGDFCSISEALGEWLSQFDSIQFISDVCHYDFVLLIDLFGTAFDLPKNVSPVCHDINMDISRHYGISEADAFNKSREEIVLGLYGKEIQGKKHNSLYDAEVTKAIYQKICE